MNTNQIPLVNQQHWLDALRADAPDIAATMADEIWDRFEIDIEEITENGVDSDLTDGIDMSLSSLLAMAYEDAFTHHIIGRCEQLNHMLATAPERVGVEYSRIDLTGLRKGLKLRRYAQALIERAIDKAKPRVVLAPSIAIGRFLRDPLQELEAVEKDTQANAQALRRELLGLRETLRAQIVEESLAAIISMKVEMGGQLSQYGLKLETKN
jgi:hypothetical protein